MNKSIRQMLSLILCLLLCAGLLPGRVWAAEIVDSGTCGENLTWTLDSEGVLTVKGNGSIPDYTYNSPWAEYKDQIKRAVISNGVTRIGEDAFRSCRNLIEVELPDSLNSVGWTAFTNCNSLTELFIPAGVEEVEYLAFGECASLISIEVSASNQVYSSIDGVLFDKSGTKLIQFPCGRTGTYAVPNGVRQIKDGAFMEAAKMQRVILPDGLEWIGNFVFVRCLSLESVSIPASVESIGVEVFQDCRALPEIAVAEENEYYRAVDGVLFTKDLSTLVAYPCGNSAASYTVPDGVGKIDVGAFRGCDTIESVVLPDGVSLIDELAFSWCSNLKSVSIPNSVTSIGDDAFFDCSSLTSVTIPNSVTSIGDRAFAECTSLTSVTIPYSVTSIGDEAFSFCSSLTDVYYGGTEDQWNAIEGGGKPTGDMITIHFFDANPSNPLGQSQPNTVGEGDKAAAVVNIASPADRPMTVYGVRYSAAGQLLGIDAYTLEAGQSGQLDIPFENGDYLRIFATDADTYAPLCKNLQVDRLA